MDDSQDSIYTAPRKRSKKKVGSRELKKGAKKAAYIVIASDGVLLLLPMAHLMFSLAYLHSWLNVIVALMGLSLAFASFVSAVTGIQKRKPFNFIIVLIYQAAVIVWGLIWIFASLTTIVSGHLWAIESIGGARSDNERPSHDIKDQTYVSPDESIPETTRAIRAGQIAIVVSIAVVFLKLWSFGVMKRCYNVFLGEDPAAKTKRSEKKPDLIPEYDYENPYATFERKFKTTGV